MTVGTMTGSAFHGFVFNESFIGEDDSSVGAAMTKKTASTRQP